MIIMRIADITLAFPTIVLALAIAAVLGPDSEKCPNRHDCRLVA